ncbi:heme biosynthesis operon protein HemX [Alteromonas sediminis]|uniref:Heme biosynthesis operon protein HemX n=1 Tax=Alteromonas sediminis TaxID=2259342 RepID=A0A3N5XX73_9ALTE|nr:uroporphyrinogen-III C-methyltransferase [Alteromonas sediminis]RPJ65382.1 heme biosynthesis operon protein HemX [Alteromonas sediminis]
MTEPELLPAQSDAAPNNPVHAKPRSRALLWTILAVNLLAVGVVAFAGYWFWASHYQALVQKVETQQVANVTVEALKDSQAMLSAEQQTLLQSQQTADNAVANVQSTLQQQAQSIAQLQAQIAALDNASTAQWLVAEAEYLTRMAGRKLWLEGDHRTAILLLQQADKRIAETANPALFPVRNSIAADIQRLEQINPVSTTSIALSLSGLISTVDNLPLNTLQLPESTLPDAEGVSEDISEWRQNLAKVWHAFKEGWIKVTPRHAPVEPIMSSAQMFLAKERVKLSLMQAQSAALKHQVTLYQQSLQQAVAALVEHFDMEAHQVTQFLSALANLQSNNVEKALPEALNSQQALESALKRMANSRQGSQAL